MENKNNKTRHDLCSGKGCFAFFGQRIHLLQAFPLNSKGSLTLEAALAVPVFLLFCCALLSFLLLLGLQTDIQTAMGETARSMDKKAYLLERFSGDAKPEKEEDDILLSVGLNPTSIKVSLLDQSSLRDTLNRSRVKGGAGGLFTYASSYDAADGILDMAVHYDYTVPWVPASFGTCRFVQRMKSRTWVGESLEKGKGQTDTEHGDKVFVTETGTVYHLSPHCSYLDLSIHAVTYDSVTKKRNVNGGKYYACPLCAAAGQGGLVYITDYGTNWHTTLGCSGLKRTIVEKDIADIGDMRPCSKCGGKNRGSHDH